MDLWFVVIQACTWSNVIRKLQGPKIASIVLAKDEKEAVDILISNCDKNLEYHTHSVSCLGSLVCCKAKSGYLTKEGVNLNDN